MSGESQAKEALTGVRPGRRGSSDGVRSLDDSPLDLGGGTEWLPFTFENLGAYGAEQDELDAACLDKLDAIQGMDDGDDCTSDGTDDERSSFPQGRSSGEAGDTGSNLSTTAGAKGPRRLSRELVPAQGGQGQLKPEAKKVECEGVRRGDSPAAVRCCWWPGDLGSQAVVTAAAAQQRRESPGSKLPPPPPPSAAASVGG